MDQQGLSSNLVFNDKQSDDRKDWLTKYKPYYPSLDKTMNMSHHLDKEQIKQLRVELQDVVDHFFDSQEPQESRSEY